MSTMWTYDVVAYVGPYDIGYDIYYMNFDIAIDIVVNFKHITLYTGFHTTNLITSAPHPLPRAAFSWFLRF